MKLKNTYYQLGPDFYQEINPTPVDKPQLLLWNTSLADKFELSEQVVLEAENYFSGNKLLQDSVPLAQAYAGHQFGGFNPQLGDGRAHLLGELVSTDGELIDLQLKGSGQTRFSRRGDGRCAIKPAVREYIMSEAMHALGVPTTRSLAVVTTGEVLYRGLAEPGAVVTRMAKSHIRVGTFQYHSAQGETDLLRKLLDYSIERHYPGIVRSNENYALAFLDAVINKQIETVVHWMRVGFIHGVMNTDNMTISGETIDYGPCAMMGVYHPETVFSSIDEQGRYCFGNQPSIMQWNMARLAECLIPLLSGEKDQIIRKLESKIIGISEKYQAAFYQMMHNKLGLSGDGNEELVDELLATMQDNKLDYTQTFINLTQHVKGKRIGSNGQKVEEFPNLKWLDKWLAEFNKGDIKQSLKLMQLNNPVVIPRNHHIENILEQTKETSRNDSVINYMTVLLSPYSETLDISEFQDLPQDNDIGYRTFCGT